MPCGYTKGHRSGKDNASQRPYEHQRDAKNAVETGRGAGLCFLVELYECYGKDYYMRTCRVLASVCVLLFAGCSLAAGSSAQKVWLGDLDISKTQQGWGDPRKNLSVDGNPIQIAGKAFERGLGTHADSILYIELNGGSSRFTAFVGVDDEVTTRGSVEFHALADGKRVYNSGVLKGGDAPKAVDLDVTGVTLLVLSVSSGEDMNYDHADWADASFTVTGTTPKTLDAPKEEAVILTPKPSPKPRINSPRVFGVRPGSPVLYTIAASGQRPMWFDAENLPAVLKLDRETGRITGKFTKPGAHTVHWRCDLMPGAYRYRFLATDLAGNTQASALAGSLKVR